MDTADTRLLDATEGQPRDRVGDDAVVDAHVACLEPVGDRCAERVVGGPYRAVQAELRVVRQAQCLVGAGDTHDRQDRAERLVGHQGHGVVDVDQYRRFEPQPGSIDAGSAGEHGGALLHGVGDVPLHQFELRSEGHRPDVTTVRVLADAGGLGEHPVDERVLHPFVDVDTLHRHAGLTGVLEGTPDGTLRRTVQVGVRADDHRVLAAEFEQHGGECVGRRGHHAPAGTGRTGEHDLVGAAAHQSLTRGAATGDHLHQIAPVVVLEQRADGETDRRGDLGRLQHHGVPGEQGGDHRCHRERERVVPRADHTDHAHGFVALPRLLVCHQAGRHRLRGEHLVAVAGVPAHRLAHGHQLGRDRFGSLFACLGADDLDEFLGPVEQAVPHGEQMPAALRVGQRGPRARDRTRSCDRCTDRDVVHVGDHADQRAVPRIERLDHRMAGQHCRDGGLRACVVGGRFGGERHDRKATPGSGCGPRTAGSIHRIDESDLFRWHLERTFNQA